MSEQRIPIIFDTDIGVDDAYALLLAAGSPALELLGITTVFGNSSVQNCTRNALKISELLGLTVPVAEGAAKALTLPLRDYGSKERSVRVHGEDGLGDKGYLLPEPRRRKEAMPAVDLMAKLIRECDRKVVLVPVGPLTNIALFLMTYPELKSSIDGVAIMGGAVYGGNALPVGEANIVADPEAAQVVFQSGIKIMMAGLDATNKAFITKDDRELFQLVGGRVGGFYYEMVKGYAAAVKRLSDQDSPAMHDSVPVAWLIDPHILETRPCHVQVDLDGRYTRACTATDTVCLRQQPNAMVAFGIDREAFVRLHTEAFKQFADR